MPKIMLKKEIFCLYCSTYNKNKNSPVVCTKCKKLIKGYYFCENFSDAIYDKIFLREAGGGVSSPSLFKNKKEAKLNCILFLKSNIKEAKEAIKELQK